MKRPEGTTIKLFLPHDDPAHLRTADVSNWNGKAVAAPRSEIKELLQRKELDDPGIYILTGIDPDSDKPMCYIGEGEAVGKRLRSHKAKDFWVHAYVFTSKSLAVCRRGHNT